MLLRLILHPFKSIMSALNFRMSGIASGAYVETGLLSSSSEICTVSAKADVLAASAAVSAIIAIRFFSFL